MSGTIPTTTVTAARPRARTRITRPPDNQGNVPAGAEEVPAPTGPREEITIEMPALRQPRVVLKVNGKDVANLLIDARVVNNNYFAADTFRVTLAMTDQGEFNSKYWCDTDAMEVELLSGFGLDAPPSTSVISGRVDDVDIDYQQRQVVLQGRDHTADMLEAKTTEKWPNKTASEIVREIAGRHGLTAVVTDTTQLAGHYYRQEHARLTDDTTEWNLLTYLAEQEGMVVFVRGRELHFEPPADERTAPRWTLEYKPSSDDQPIGKAPAARLHLRRSLTLARDITVKVVSWNARSKRAITVTRNTRLLARSTTKGNFGTRTPYVFRLPGLTEDQAIREAERRLADLSKHERMVTVVIPGEAKIDTRTIMTLRGTGTSFDQDYRLDEIERRWSQREGFVMTLTARNMAPQSSAAL